MIRFSRYTPFVLLLIVIITGSCTIQKRVHRKGWFVQWHVKQNQHEKECESDGEFGLESEVKNKVQADIEPVEIKTKERQKLSKVEPIVSTSSSTDSKIRYPFQLDFENEEQLDLESESEEKKIETPNKSNALSPTRIPTLAWVLLYIGIALVVLGIVLGIMFFVANGSLIGAPLYIILALISGILFLVWATQTALAPLNSQPSPPDPRFEKEEPKKEKKERQPLQKRDKIFLAVIAGLIAVIGISLLLY